LGDQVDVIAVRIRNSGGSSRVATSGVGSTTAIAMSCTSVRTANPKITTCTTGKSRRIPSVCRSRRRWRVSFRTNPAKALTRRLQVASA